MALTVAVFVGCQTRQPSVSLTAADGSAVTVKVEIADDPDEIAKGLMYRESLGPMSGMLFLMGDEKIQSFWMRNTLIPLDMLFISRDKRVVGIVKNTTPRTDTSRRVDKPSSYVLEVNGGFCDQHNIEVGAAVTFSNVPGN